MIHTSMPIPEQIRIGEGGQQIVLVYDGMEYILSAEYLRVYSPSAEVRGHGHAVLQVGKRGIGILKILPAGNYAVKMIFSDGHNTGLYDWSYLHKLALDQQTLWQQYLDKLAATGTSRDAIVDQ